MVEIGRASRRYRDSPGAGERTAAETADGVGPISSGRLAAPPEEESPQPAPSKLIVADSGIGETETVSRYRSPAGSRKLNANVMSAAVVMPLK
jgi:hypothetical protein